ncbi:MAG: hypothetical protein FWD63_08725 [Propionibacteriaceae bacterium]|nr:hypothetical protein [Propionibacteriaceae bacterium]
MKRKARVLAALLAAASVLAFSGCSVRAQTAFTVDGEVTTMTQVNDTINGCAAAFGEQPSTLSAPSVTDAMIVAQLSRVIAQEQKTQTSDADLTSMIQNGQMPGLSPDFLTDPTCADLAVGLALQALLVFQMGTDPFLAAVQNHAVAVNPRFGAWNPDDLTLSGSGSLSMPANG